MLMNTMRRVNSRGLFSRGFTLIELLVVIAVIALLIGLLLPAVGRARKSGWLVKSLSNVRGIGTANFTYQSDWKGYSAFAAVKGRNGGGRGQWRETPTDLPQLSGVASWCFGGKENDGYWVAGANAFGGAFDFESADRPLNRYMSNDTLYPYEQISEGMIPANAPIRTEFDLNYFRDPSDKASLQQNWAYNADPTNTRRLRVSTALLSGEQISSYDDVGTSYHMNFKWFDWVYQRTSGTNRFGRAWFRGMRVFRQADGISPSRFVFVHDQYADLIANSTSQQYQLVNGYGDINKSILGFFDGHAAIKKIRPGATADSFSNEDYSLIFDFVRLN